jgi:pyruvate kinase
MDKPPFSRTKIVCTMGPSTHSLKKVLALIQAGMNVARLNFSHGTHAEHLETIQTLKKAREQMGMPLAIMADLRGPKIRLGTLPGDAYEVHPGTLVRLISEENYRGDSSTLPMNPAEVLETVRPGMKILFDDGYIIGQVVEQEHREAVIEIKNGGILKSQKGINIPGAQITLPAMTPQDLEDLTFAAEQDVDLIAASFIRSAHDVFSIKRSLAQHKDILVIAKIESTQGVENFESIMQAADGIMVARGDLGVEVDLARVPKLQKMMIRTCLQASKPVITATQMLESMISHPRPTRAEVSDVANAIYDGTSAVMLSAETAIGKYPVEAVRVMKNIICEAEADYNYHQFFEQRAHREYHDLSSAVSLAAVKTAYAANARAIYAFTTSGLTARLVSRLRPQMPIFALTSHPKVYQQLALNWGVTPLFGTSYDVKEAIEMTTRYAMQHEFLSFGDLVVVTSGAPFGTKGTTNMMRLEQIGEVLVRGHKGIGNKVTGKVVVLLSPEGCDPESLRNRIVLLLHCDQTFLVALKYVAGVVLQNYSGDSASEKYALTVAKTYHFSLISRADGAMTSLQEGEEVTLDPHRGLVYRNVTFPHSGAEKS